MAKTPDLLPSKEGAPQALSWVAKQEAKSRSEVERFEKELVAALSAQSNPANDGSEELDKKVGYARRNLSESIDTQFRWLNTLQKLDKSVAPEKRDASESITQGDGSRLFQMIVICMRTSGEDLIGLLSQSILQECKTSEDVYAMFGAKYRECVVNSIKGAVNEAHLPAWVSKAIEEVL